MLDPGVQASAADLDAQLQASFAAQALQARVNAVVERVDTMIGQLSAIDGQLPRQNPPAYSAQVKQALDTLKKFKDEELVRPIPGLGYRQYPRLREDVQSLSGLSRPRVPGAERRRSRADERPDGPGRSGRCEGQRPHRERHRGDQRGYEGLAAHCRRARQVASAR